MNDLLIRNATLPDGLQGIDVLCLNGHIESVAHQVSAPPGIPTLDANGQLLSPPFVDPHFHMDATLSLGQPRLNESGTLLEGIGLWGELKPTLTIDAVIERAMRYCDWAAGQGIQAIRSHVDICDPSLLAVQALLQVRENTRHYLDLQLVAFPQDGLLRADGARENLVRALDAGVDVIGGIPHFERTMSDGARSIEWLCELAASRGLMVDMHCDESDDPMSRHVETLAALTVATGLQGRVTGSHLTSMHSMDNYYASKLIPLIAEARLHVVANPLINITLQGRHDQYPKRRGLTRVPELMAQGVNVAFGQDCVMDPWYSMGSADMLEVASMGLHVAQMTSRDAMHDCFDAVTTNGARVMQLEHYGLEPGCHASFVLLQASDPVEAIRLRATRLAVVRQGRIIARAEPRVATLAIEGRPGQVDWRLPVPSITGTEQSGSAPV